MTKKLLKCNPANKTTSKKTQEKKVDHITVASPTGMDRIKFAYVQEVPFQPEILLRRKGQPLPTLSRTPSNPSVLKWRCPVVFPLQNADPWFLSALALSSLRRWLPFPRRSSSKNEAIGRGLSLAFRSSPSFPSPVCFLRPSVLHLGRQTQEREVVLLSPAADLATGPLCLRRRIFSLFSLRRTGAM